MKRYDKGCKGMRLSKDGQWCLYEDAKKQRDELLDALKAVLSVMPVLPREAKYILGMEESYAHALGNANSIIANANAIVNDDQLDDILSQGC